ncbi:hypothetical protein [Parafrankia sp. EUN1f]|uniref:hypothetical protein n=1 Tax=Parafrankia sp. EUN1f TaxID=102897 RepID=UPI0012FA096C|nr:hypothetical protein [Parafrankia sp. EUN1f]
MTIHHDRAQAHALVERLVGLPDQAADRAVTVLHAHAAALAWVRTAAALHPTPPAIAAELNAAAERLRSVDGRDPAPVLGQAAIAALTAHRARAVA